MNIWTEIKNFLLDTETATVSKPKWDTLASSTTSHVTIPTENLKNLLSASDKMFDLILDAQISGNMDKLAIAATNYFRIRFVNNVNID